MFKYLDELKSLNLPKGEYAIFGSGPLGVRELRECRDIDMLVTEKLFEEYKNRSGWNFQEFKRDGRFVKMLEKDNIELYMDWGPGEWDVNKLIHEAETIDDLSFVQLQDVLKWKKISNRDKDKNDVRLIEEYLNKKD